MAEKKLIHFNSDSDYQSQKDDINGSSIVFVKDSHKIATHGAEYQFQGWSILEPSLFPMYLKTEQGSGNYRTRAADEQSLALLEYYNKNKLDATTTTTTMLYTLDLESLGLVLYIDELLVTNMAEPREGIIRLSIPSLTGVWYNYLNSDGTISIYKD